MTNTSTNRRRRWPRYTEMARAEAEELAADAAQNLAEALKLRESERRERKRHNSLVADLMEADAMILEADARAMIERIHRLLIEAKQGSE